jgi:hypothetical protein
VTYHRRVRAALVLIACAACGVPTPAAVPDASESFLDAQPGHGQLVHATHSGPMAGTSTLVIPTLTDGDALVVVVALPEGGTLIKNVSAGNNFIRAWFRNGPSESCMASTEIWISWLPISGDVSTVTVERDDDRPFTIAAYELAGVSGALSSAQATAPVVMPGTAPLLDAQPGDLVFSVLTTCGMVSGVAATSPFVALDTSDDGASTAYYLPTSNGTYGGAWSYNGGPWEGSTITFR